MQTYTVTAGYSQLINKATHYVTGSSTCIDFIFTYNTNLITYFGVDPTLNRACHHNLIFGEISFNIPLPPPFYRDTWDYKSTYVEIIQKAVIDFKWKRAFSNRSINENIRCFSETKKNVFSNYILNRRIQIDYRKPKWITPKISADLKVKSLEKVLCESISDK